MPPKKKRTACQEPEATAETRIQDIYTRPADDFLEVEEGLTEAGYRVRDGIGVVGVEEREEEPEIEEEEVVEGEREGADTVPGAVLKIGGGYNLLEFAKLLKAVMKQDRDPFAINPRDAVKEIPSYREGGHLAKSIRSLEAELLEIHMPNARGIICLLVIAVWHGIGGPRV